jgi:aspartate/methionine/tyrosine aminotransferase
MRFNVEGFRAAVKGHASPGGKLIVLLNFPNNPIGYMPTTPEAMGLRDALREAADAGANIVAVMDDAYFGLGYDDEAMKESLFAQLAGLHPRLLAIRLDGATKELFVWGFRVGFITYSVGGLQHASPLLAALEKKTAGAIRGALSNAPRLSQEVVLRALQSPDFPRQRREKYEILKARAEALRALVGEKRFADVWQPYPFNSGYFMCVRLREPSAEAVRVRLLNAYGIGVIATDERDLRIAFSCVELKDIPELVNAMRQAVLDVRRGL